MPRSKPLLRGLKKRFIMSLGCETLGASAKSQASTLDRGKCSPTALNGLKYPKRLAWLDEMLYFGDDMKICSERGVDAEVKITLKFKIR